MSLRIYVDAYSGYRANERPRQFCLDEDVFEITEVERRWYEPNVEYFKVRTTEGKRYTLRYNGREDEWTLQSAFDGAALLAKPSIELIPVEPSMIRRTESQLAGCERCRPEQSELPFDAILADVMDKHGAFEFILSEPGRCSNCKGELTEKTLVEPQGGIEVEMKL